MNKILHLIYIALMAAALCACASETNEGPDGPDGGVSEAPFRVVTAETGEDAVTPANELINSWWVAMVDSRGVVRAIVWRDCSQAVWQDDFKATLTHGTYSAIAFANRIPVENIDTDGKKYYTYEVGSTTLRFKEGEAAPTGLDELRWDETAPQNWPANTPVPMTGYQTGLQVTGRQTEPFNIEVVRLVAKLEFQFTNGGERDLTVHNVTLNSMGADRIFFFPTYEKLGFAPVLPTPYTMQDVTFRIKETLAARSADTYTAKRSFYILESSAVNLLPKCYKLTAQVTHEAGNGLAATTDDITALLTDIQSINRNDHIIVPVTFTDWLVEPQVTFYPPIGGYPVMITEEKKQEFYIRFGSMGEFSILPRPRIATPGSQWLSADEYTCDLDFDLLSTSNIFAKDPKIDPVTKEITGVIGSNPGTARIQLTLWLPCGGVRVGIKRTIFIIRD